MTNSPTKMEYEIAWKPSSACAFCMFRGAWVPVLVRVRPKRVDTMSTTPGLGLASAR